jgi:hypothetical protein
MSAGQLLKENWQTLFKSVSIAQIQAAVEVQAMTFTGMSFQDRNE